MGLGGSTGREHDSTPKLLAAQTHRCENKRIVLRLVCCCRLSVVGWLSGCLVVWLVVWLLIWLVTCVLRRGFKICRQQVANVWPTTTCSITAPERRLTATRKTPAVDKQSSCLSSSFLPEQSLHVEKTSSVSPLTPVQSLPQWARLSYRKVLTSKTKPN